MKYWSKLFLFLLFSFSISVVAQQEKVDSLKLLLEKTDSDTQKINLLFHMIEVEPEDSIWPKHNKQAEEILATKVNAKASGLQKFYANAKGKINTYKGKVYSEKGNYEEAIKYYHNALDWFEKEGISSGIAGSYNGIGFIHLNLGQFEEAASFFEQSIQGYELIKDTSGMAQSLANAAVTYGFLKQPEKQKQKLKEALKLSLLSNNQMAAASAMQNLSVHFYSNNQQDSAIDYMNMSLDITKKSMRKHDLCFSYLSASGLYRVLGRTDTAIFYGKKALAIGENLNSIDLIKRSALELYTVYELDSNYQEALKYHKLYRDQRDSLLKEESQTAALKKQFSFEKEKQAAITKAEKDKQKLITIMISVGLLLVLIFAGFMFNRFKITQKQKKIIEVQQRETEQQKEIVEEKNKEITDSINYAKRLQQAILPPDKLIKQHLPNSFVFFKPKDVVSGDFYWMESLPLTPSQGGGKVLFAAADCTGHGVPGAMVSVVCNNALNRSVNEYGLHEPAKILDKTRELVIETFEKSDEDVKDGMDIALCSISLPPVGDPEASGGGGLLQYAGANNPLWIYRKGINDLLQLEEVRADKQPIGKHSNERPFTNHKLNLQKGDTVYFFTDGFADQFGGDKGKKFKYKPFKELLLSIQNNTMEEQHQILANKFESWRGDLEQIDDVCVIGVRV